ncbi:MAG: hypothetical protein HOO09_06900 [Rhodospirillaceae bacterium]|nr:hypothetical protein [Rhodospirillaceae bacterium]
MSFLLDLFILSYRSSTAESKPNGWTATEDAVYLSPDWKSTPKTLQKQLFASTVL